MKTLVLLDAGILLDAAIPARSGHDAACALFEEMNRNADLLAYAAGTSVKDMYGELARCNAAEARRQVLDLMDLLTVVPVDERAYREALRSDEPDFADGIVRSCAERADVDFIISSNEDAFERSYIKRLSAQKFVELFCGEPGCTKTPQG